jgi:aspartyl-tRNA(Asn)/glutamyl-tRNA(Gln) amidotransferase subunit A
MVARKLIRDDFARVFADVDAVVMPTSPVPAFKIGEKSADPLSLYAADIFTVPINIAGVPAISVPCGTVARDGVPLPVGIQFIAAHTGEDTLFAIGQDVEKVNS